MADKIGNKDGQIILPEISAPSDVADHGQIWAESDNTLHFMDGAGSDQKVALFGADYGEMAVTAQTASTIETANSPHAVVAWVTGAVANWTFTTGITNGITAYADYSGTVAGTVKATSNGHGLTTGDYIAIRGTTNYNGVFQITVIDVNEFYFTDTWAGDDGASDFEMGDYLTPGTGADGTYQVTWNMSASEGGAAGSTFQFEIYINTTAQAKVGAERKFANNDVGSMNGGGIITIAASDRVWFALQPSGTNDLTIERANICLFEI
jgi:hypothetical protein